MSIRAIAVGLMLLLAGGAYAEQMVFSRIAFLNGDGQEMTVSDGTTWKIQILPIRTCPLGQNCPSIIIDGEFKVGDNGEVRKASKTGLTSRQLAGEPLWISAGSTVIVPDGATNVLVQEYIASLAPVKEPVPVNVSYRQSVLGNGLVAIFTNRGGKYLNLIVTVQNKKAFRVDLALGQAQEIGHMEGWAFQYGELINVRSLANDFEPINIRM